VTRHQLGDTIEALAERTDVRAQAKHKVAESNAYISKKKDELLAKARETSPQSLVSAVQHAARTARENPLELATISAFALGVVIGRRSKRLPEAQDPS
jgi:Protein of unknown function (DUF3618)